MEISRINAIGSTVDRTFDLASQKASSAGSRNPPEKRGADTVKDTVRVDDITVTDSKLTEDFLQKTIDRVNKQLRGTNREFNYSVHERTGQFIVKVIDRETKEIIREIPPEKNLDAVAKMWDLMGIFINEKI